MRVLLLLLMMLSITKTTLFMNELLIGIEQVRMIETISEYIVVNNGNL